MYIRSHPLNFDAEVVNLMSFNQNRNIYSTFRVFILAVSLISRFSKAYILKSRTYRLGIFQFNFVRILNLDSIDVTTIPSCVKRRMSESLQRFRGKWIQLHPATHPSSCFRSSEKGSLIDLSYSNMSATLLSTSLSVNVEAFKLIETNGSEVTSDAQDNIQYNVRFQNIGKLYGDPNEALCFLRNAHVCVIGLGGVGSWAVESLARSGIGKLTLVDPDDICVSNTNRQIHATSSSVGQFKGEVLKRRGNEITSTSRM